MLDFLFIITVVVSALALLAGLQSRNIGLLWMITLSYIVFQMIIPGWVQHNTNSYQWVVGTVDNKEAENAVSVVLLFVAAFVGAYCLAQNRNTKWPQQSSQIMAGNNVEREARFLLLTCTAAIVSAIAALIFVGPVALMGTRQDITSASAPSDGLVFYGLFVLLPRAIASVLIIQLVALRRTLKIMLQYSFVSVFCLFGASLALNSIILWPTAQPRVIIFGITFACFCAAFYQYKTLVSVLCVLLVPVGIYIMLPVFGLFNRTLVLGELQTIDIAAALVAPDYSCFEFLAHTMHYVKGEGTVAGMNIATAMLFFIPRSLLTAKLPHSGEIVAEYVGLPFLNVAVPIVAEGYLAGGAFGVVVIGLVVGLLAARIDRMFLLQAGGQAPVIVAVCVGYWVYILRGSLLPATAFVLPQIAIIVLFWKCVAAGSGNAAALETDRKYRVRDC